MGLSTDEVEYIKSILNARRHELKKALSLGRPNLPSMASPEETERATLHTLHEMAASLVERNNIELKLVVSTIAKIDNGSFGFCVKCQEVISFPRLKARPTATLCFDCQDAHETFSSSFGPRAYRIV